MFKAMRFISPTEGLVQVLRETCRLIVYDVPAVRSAPSLGRSWALTSTFDLRLLGLWVVIDIINSIARRGSPCVLAPPSLVLRSECCGRGAPTKVVCADCMKKLLSWRKNSVIKGLTQCVHGGSINNWNTLPNWSTVQVKAALRPHPH